MPFRIHALEAADFAPLFALDDAALAARGGRFETVAEHPGTPCRVSLADAEIGERVVLVNHLHLDAATPYRASHAVYVREGAATARPVPGEVPEVLRRRLLSLRAFSGDGMMLGAAIVPGTELAPAIEAAFADAGVATVHLHYAAPGCFAARVTRA